MIPVKIQCGCGQRYAFEVEAVGGRMPAAVACPVCGADGTVVANAVIARTLAAQPAAAAAPVRAAPVRVAVAAPSVLAPTAAPRGGAPRAAQIDTKTTDEARAKIFWGDPPEDVLKFLMMQGIGYEEASELIRGMVNERASTVRRDGIRKILIGVALVCVPIVALIFFASVGVIPLKLFALTVMVGLWGAWMLLKGTMMALAPKSEPGDLADK